MAKITQKEIYENRLKVVKYLQKPSLKKAREELRSKGGGRCCLGHMSDALGVECHYNQFDEQYKYGKYGDYSYAPQEIINQLGMFNRHGSISNGTFKGEKTLIGVNDETRTSPQAIGKYLESVILGGDGSPWKAIKKPKEFNEEI